MTNDDMALLREYARRGSEQAFATLVARHVHLVYSVALRQVGQAQLAEEITQAAFLILARKAGSLGDKTILSGWLCRTARFVSADALKTQRRRQLREQEAHMQSILNETSPEAWTQIAPLLDPALAQLGEKDHNAIVLRYFENKKMSEVGLALGSSESAAKMRVNRALEKLRRYFAKRGVHSTTAVIAGAISSNSVQAAPALLTKSVTAAALAKGSAASASILTLTKGASKRMAWSNAKTALTIGFAMLLVAVAGTGVVGKIRSLEARRACAGTTRLTLTGTDGANFTGFYVKDGNTTLISNSVPWSFAAAGISSFELVKSNRQDTVRVELHYDSDVAHAMQAQTLDLRWLRLRGRVENGLISGVLPQ